MLDTQSSYASRDKQVNTLFQRMHDEALCQHQRDSARDELFGLLRNLSLSIGRQIMPDWSGSEEDLESECHLALMEALNYWRPEKGAITTAIWYCLQERMREFCRYAFVINRSYSALNRAYRLRKQGEAPNSVDAPVCISLSGADAEGDSVTIDLPDSSDFAEKITLAIAVNQVVDTLPMHERSAVVLCYGLHGNDVHTLREAATKLNCSHEKVRLTLMHAKKTLHQGLSGCAT